MSTFINDIKFALRQLRKSPGFTAVVVLTLALGIGATTAIVSVAWTTLWDPLPVRLSSDRYLQLASMTKGKAFDRDGLAYVGITPREFREILREKTLFERVAAFGQVSALHLPGDTFPDPVHGVRVSPEFFALWAHKPLLGRTFMAEDTGPGHDNTIIVNYRFWKNRLGGDRDVIGRVIQFREGAMTVIGVMPRFFAFPKVSTDYWRPLSNARSISGIEEGVYSSPHIGVLVEMAQGVERAQVQAFLRVVSNRLAAAYPIALDTPFELRCRSLRERFATPELRQTLWILLGAVVFVLLIASANIANLQLARFHRRRQEFAVRVALGAGRRQLFRLLVSESLVLGCLGGVASLWVVWIGLDLLQTLIPPELPRLKPIEVNTSVLWLTLTTTLATGLVFGLAPMRPGFCANLTQAMKVGSATTSGDRRGSLFTRALIVGQLAVAVTLLAGAGLMVHSVVKILRVDVGFNPRHLVSISPRFPRNTFWRDRTSSKEAKRREVENRNAVYFEMQERLAALPGVASAGVTGWGSSDFSASPVAGGQSIDLQEHFIGTDRADPLRVIGVPIRQGRWLQWTDAGESNSGVLINESAARALWPEGNGVGKRLWRRKRTGDTSFEYLPFTVVGVVGDMRFYRYDSAQPPSIFRVVHGNMNRTDGLSLIVRTTVHPSQRHQAMGLELKAIGANARPPFVRNVEAALFDATAGRRTLMLYLLVFSSVGVFLAAIGLYGILAYSVTRRTREIGIRIAVGAQGAEIQRLVLRQGVTLIGIGLTIGLIVALALGRVLQTFLFGLPANDPMTLLGVALVLSLIALSACWLPARRAAKVDPMVALRCE